MPLNRLKPTMAYRERDASRDGPGSKITVDSRREDEKWEESGKYSLWIERERNGGRGRERERERERGGGVKSGGEWGI